MRGKWKKLIKQGLAVSLVLAMCMTTGQFTVFADTDETVETDGGELELNSTVKNSANIDSGNLVAENIIKKDAALDTDASEDGASGQDTEKDNDDDKSSVPQVHTHDNWGGEVVTKEATCTETGIKTFKCQVEGCEETKTEEIPMKDHTDGDEDKVCDVCGASLAKEDSEADPEAVQNFVQAVEALKNWEAKDDASAEEMEKDLADYKASYESTKALYDALTDEQKQLEEVQKAHEDLKKIGETLEIMLTKTDSVSGEMTGSEFLEKAVDGVITLDGDVTLTDNVVWVQKTLTLDLHDHTIYGRVACYKGNLTIKDSGNAGCIDTKDLGWSPLLNNGEAGTTTLTVEGGTFISSDGVNSLYNMNGAVANIEGGIFENGVGNGWWDETNAQAQDGGGVVNISGGVIKTQSFTADDTTIFIPAINNAAEVNISGAAEILSENDAGVIDNYGTMNIQGGSVKAKANSFGVMGNYYNGTVNITGGEFVGAIENWFTDANTKPIKIYGGKFSFNEGYRDKMNSYLADGYTFNEAGEAVPEDDADFEASVTIDGATVKYFTLAEAVAAAKNGSTVTLLKNVTLASKEDQKPVTIENKAIALDLNGHLLTGWGYDAASIGNSRYKTIDVKDTGSLTVKSSDAEHAGEIRGSNYYAIWTKGSLTIESGRVTNVEINKDFNLQAIGASGRSASVTIEKDAEVVSTLHGIQAQLGANLTVNGGTIIADGTAIYGLTNQKESRGTVTINEGSCVETTGKKNPKSPESFAAASISSYSLVINGGTLNGAYAVALDTYGNNDKAKDFGTSTLKMTGGTINATIQAIGLNNLKSAGTTAEISGGTITALDKTAIYWPAEGTLTIKGNVTISGGTGIEMKMGTLNIEGGTITGSGEYKTDEPTNGGAGPEGSALLVSAQMYDNCVDSPDLKVNITGGNLISEKGNAVTVYNTMKKEVPATISVSDGTLTGANSKNAFYVFTAENSSVKNCTTNSISGGLFSSEVFKDYCAKGYVPTTTPDENGKYTVVTKEEAAVATITTSDGTTKYYPTLQAAVQAAESGQTIQLVKDAELTSIGSRGTNPYVAVQKELTIDLNGHTASGGYLWAYGPNAKVTVQDSSEAQTGKIDGTSGIYGYGIRVSGTEDAVVNVKSGTVAGKYGIRLQNGKVNVSGGIVSGTKTGISTVGKATEKKVISITGGEVKCIAAETDEKYNETSAINAMYGTQLTVSGSTTVINGGFSGIGMWDDNTTVEIGSGAKVQGTVYGVTGNGSKDSDGSLQVNTLSVTGGEISGGYTGIYHPQGGAVTVSDGTITGSAGTGIEMRAGELEVTGGSIIANAGEFSCNPNGSGATTKGAAIAIAQHTTRQDIKVTIAGGMFRGVKALNESNPQENDPSPQVTLSVTAGTFHGDVSVTDTQKFISGGTFSQAVSTAYCSDGYTSVMSSDGMYSVQRVGDTGGTTGGNTSGSGTTTGGTSSGGTTGGGTSTAAAPVAAPTALAVAPAAVPAPAVAPAPAAAEAAPEAEDETAAAGYEELEDEEVPLAGGEDVGEAEEEKEEKTAVLEDEEVPLAANESNHWWLFGIIPVVLAAGFIFFIILWKRRKEEEEA